jgi:hypothetical protein
MACVEGVVELSIGEYDCVHRQLGFIADEGAAGVPQGEIGSGNQAENHPVHRAKI